MRLMAAHILYALIHSSQEAQEIARRYSEISKLGPMVDADDDYILRVFTANIVREMCKITSNIHEFWPQVSKKDKLEHEQFPLSRIPDSSWLGALADYLSGQSVRRGSHGDSQPIITRLLSIDAGSRSFKDHPNGNILAVISNRVGFNFIIPGTVSTPLVLLELSLDSQCTCLVDERTSPENRSVEGDDVDVIIQTAERGYQLAEGTRSALDSAVLVLPQYEQGEAFERHASRVLELLPPLEDRPAIQPSSHAESRSFRKIAYDMIDVEGGSEEDVSSTSSASSIIGIGTDTSQQKVSRSRSRQSSRITEAKLKEAGREKTSVAAASQGSLRPGERQEFLNQPPLINSRILTKGKSSIAQDDVVTAERSLNMEFGSYVEQSKRLAKNENEPSRHAKLAQPSAGARQNRISAQRVASSPSNRVHRLTSKRASAAVKSIDWDSGNMADESNVLAPVAKKPRLTRPMAKVTSRQTQAKTRKSQQAGVNANHDEFELEDGDDTAAAASAAGKVVTKQDRSVADKVVKSEASKPAKGAPKSTIKGRKALQSMDTNKSLATTRPRRSQLKSKTYIEESDTDIENAHEAVEDKPETRNEFQEPAVVATLSQQPAEAVRRPVSSSDRHDRAQLDHGVASSPHVPLRGATKTTEVAETHKALVAASPTRKTQLQQTSISADANDSPSETAENSYPRVATKSQGARVSFGSKLGQAITNNSKKLPNNKKSTLHPGSTSSRKAAVPVRTSAQQQETELSGPLPGLADPTALHEDDQDHGFQQGNEPRDTNANATVDLTQDSDESPSVEGRNELDQIQDDLEVIEGEAAINAHVTRYHDRDETAPIQQDEQAPRRSPRNARAKLHATECSTQAKTPQRGKTLHAVGLGAPEGEVTTLKKSTTKKSQLVHFSTQGPQNQGIPSPDKQPSKKNTTHKRSRFAAAKLNPFVDISTLANTTDTAAEVDYDESGFVVDDDTVVQKDRESLFPEESAPALSRHLPPQGPQSSRVDWNGSPRLSQPHLHCPTPKARSQEERRPPHPAIMVKSIFRESLGLSHMVEKQYPDAQKTLATEAFRNPALQTVVSRSLDISPSMPVVKPQALAQALKPCRHFLEEMSANQKTSTVASLQPHPASESEEGAPASLMTTLREHAKRNIEQEDTILDNLNRSKRARRTTKNADTTLVQDHSTPQYASPQSVESSVSSVSPAPEAEINTASRQVDVRWQDSAREAQQGVRDALLEITEVSKNLSSYLTMLILMSRIS